jgi:hypothetical protein
MRRAGPDVVAVKNTSVGSSDARTITCSRAAPEGNEPGLDSGQVHEAYLIGIALGGGAGIGVIAAGLLARLPSSAAVAIVGAVVAAAATLVFFGLTEVAFGAAGGVIGGASASTFARGALRRGGTVGGTALLVGGAGVALALLAAIPALGYVEVVALPALAARARRRAAEKYAGLRTLAR